MDEKKLRICHVITRMIVGGAQENTLLTIKGHLEAGHHVELATGPSPGREGKLLENTGIQAFPIVEFPDMVRELSPLHDIKAFFALKKYFKAGKFDVVHTHSSKAGIIGRIAGRMAGVPVVVHTIHGLAFGPYESRMKNLIYISAERYAARKCDRIYSVAQAMIDQCLEQKIGTPDLFKVVYSGMELDRFLQAENSLSLREKLGIPAQAKVVGAVARLFPRKGYEDFFPVAAKVAAKLPETRFLIMGDGPSRADYEKLCDELKIRDKVIFAGLISPDQIADYIALTDTVAHFSLKEGLPRVAVQALAEAKPVVAYPLDGTPEVVLHDQSGYLVQPGDREAAADALIRILSDETTQKRLGTAGREIVRDKFPWQKMSQALIEDYERLLAAK